MKTIRKTLYTLCVDNYEPEITALTFPLMQRYAEKIGADFHIIDQRRFPEWPAPYEKLQLFELGREHGNDWNIFFDADTLIHPDFWDVTSVLPKDTTASNGSDFVPHRFRTDEYFLRDGRMIGKGNWCAVVSDWCLDYWRPLEMTPEEARSNIFPVMSELQSVIAPEHLIDDYAVSRNIARFGLKHVLIPQLPYPAKVDGLLWHQYQYPAEQKVVLMRKQLRDWGVA